MAKTNWSSYQTAIFTEVKRGANNVVIQAVAGSGKTTTVVECANILCRLNKRLSVAYFAFNKSAATNLQNKLSGTAVKCSTMHAFGLEVIRNSVGKQAERKIKINGSKYRKYFTENYWKLSKVVTIDYDPADVSKFVGNLCDLMAFARRDLLRSGDDLMDKLNAIIDTHDIPTLADETDVIAAIIDKTYAYPCPLFANPYELSFDDMIILPIAADMKVPTFDRVFVDEAQDLTEAQKCLMLRSVKRDGHFIAVGDENQTLYGFCGCKNTLKELGDMDNTVTLPLSVSYRCSQAIVERAKQIVPTIEAAQGASQGEVVEADNIDTLSVGSMVIARRKADVITLCLKGIKSGRPVMFVGESIKSRLKAFVLSLGCKYTRDMPEAVSEARNRVLQAYAERHGITAAQAEDTSYMQRWDDTRDCALLLMQDTETQREVLNNIDTMFKERDAAKVITFATIHTAKGLEADTVYIIGEPRSKAAKTPEELFAEQCAEYVAITRAINKLILVKDMDVNTVKADHWG